MAMAARASLTSDGAFCASEIRAVNEIDARKAQAVIDQLATDGLITQVDEDGAEKRYTFIEEGLPTYLWISWASRTCTPRRPRRRARRRRPPLPDEPTDASVAAWRGARPAPGRRYLFAGAAGAGAAAGAPAAGAGVAALGGGGLKPAL